MFRLLVCLVLSVGAGLYAGSWAALKLRMAGEPQRARWALMRGALVTSLSMLLLMLLFFGWPWKRESISTFEEVVETVTVPEEQVVYSWNSWFPQRSVITRQTQVNVTRQRPVEQVQKHFSAWLLTCELGIAALAYYLQLWTCAILWRITPRRLLT